MSLKYKFDKLHESDPEKNTGEGKVEDAKNIERFDTKSHVRNLCLVDKSGKQFFLNYSYLSSGEFLPEENTITLDFSSHSVTLKGNNLESLFEHLLAHGVKRIVCVDERYAATKAETEVLVSAMAIAKNN